MSVELPPAPEDDGLPVREAGQWAKDKLAVIECYLDAFATACSKKAKSWHLVDGFAGPGVNEIRETGELVWGSPMLGVRTQPAFDQCLFMDSGRQEYRALTERTEGFRERVVVRQGDVNGDLTTAMYEVLNRRAPVLCLLDPEGANLGWETVEALSRFRVGRFKTEMLILFPTHTGFIRMLPVEGESEPWAPAKLDYIYGDGRWRRIWRARQKGEISTDQATTHYVRLYRDRLVELGYPAELVLDREIRRGGRGGQLLYFLIFATTHDRGREIMDHCMDTRYQQPSLFRTERPKRLS